MMPIYEFRCRDCSTTVLDTNIHLHQDTVCEHCGGPLKKVFAVNLPGPGAVFQPHFNHAIGAFVTSFADFEHKLRRRQERQVELTGIDHNYTPIHPADMTKSNLKVTDEGLDSQLYDKDTKRTFV